MSQSGPCLEIVTICIYLDILVFIILIQQFAICVQQRKKNLPIKGNIPMRDISNLSFKSLWTQITIFFFNFISLFPNKIIWPTHYTGWGLSELSPSDNCPNSTCFRGHHPHYSFCLENKASPAASNTTTVTVMEGLALTDRTSVLLLEDFLRRSFSNTRARP